MSHEFHFLDLKLPSYKSHDICYSVMVPPDLVGVMVVAVFQVVSHLFDKMLGFVCDLFWVEAIWFTQAIQLVFEIFPVIHQ